MAGHRVESELAPVEIHEVLSNERRQMILTLLGEANEAMTARELSERIAELETGESPPPRNIRQSAYVSLHQTHLPKLDELDIVEYDQSSKSVALYDRAKEVSVYMETVPTYGLAWSEYYFALGIIGLLLLAAAEVGVPGIAGVGAVPLAAFSFVIIAGSAVYQTMTQGSSLLHRLREQRS